jgi:hypothetical protein
VNIIFWSVLLCTVWGVGFYFALRYAPKRMPRKPKDEWAIHGFDKLLAAIEGARGTSLKATVRTKEGKVYVIDLIEVRELPDGTLERVEAEHGR